MNMNPVTDHELILMGMHEIELPGFWTAFHRAYAAAALKPRAADAAREMATLFIEARTAEVMKLHQQQQRRSPNRQANHPARGTRR